MDFREATDCLFDRVDHERLARELGVLVASVRQARLKPTAGAHRAPPHNWQEGVARLAAQQVKRYGLLLENLGDPKLSLDRLPRHKGDKPVDRRYWAKPLIFVV